MKKPLHDTEGHQSENKEKENSQGLLSGGLMSSFLHLRFLIQIYLMPRIIPLDLKAADILLDGEIIAKSIMAKHFLQGNRSRIGRKQKAVKEKLDLFLLMVVVVVAEQEEVQGIQHLCTISDSSG